MITESQSIIKLLKEKRLACRIFDECKKGKRLGTANEICFLKQVNEDSNTDCDFEKSEVMLFTKEFEHRLGYI